MAPKGVMASMHEQSIGQQLWRWYQGVLSVLVSSMMVCLSVVMPAGAVWLIGWPPRGDGSPATSLLVGLLLAVLLWPINICMALQMPRTWRLMAWPTERYAAWQREQEARK